MSLSRERNRQGRRVKYVLSDRCNQRHVGRASSDRCVGRREILVNNAGPLNLLGDQWLLDPRFDTGR